MEPVGALTWDNRPHSQRLIPPSRAVRLHFLHLAMFNAHVGQLASLWSPAASAGGTAGGAGKRERMQIRGLSHLPTVGGRKVYKEEPEQRSRHSSHLKSLA
jgi:hypothetical protein